MSYQVGQAVICDTNSGKELLFVKQTFVSYISVEDIDGDEVDRNYYTIYRPATEAEILAEAVKYGWELDVFNHLRSNHGIWIAKTDHWFVNGGVDITAHKNLNVFGQECITAHRLITALNLAK